MIKYLLLLRTFEIHNMMLDVVAKVRHFGCSTIFSTLSAGEFHWPEIIQIVARQYGTTLTTEQVNQMDWKTKVMCLKRKIWLHKLIIYSDKYSVKLFTVVCIILVKY